MEMQDIDPLIREVCALLHSRGREVTPVQVVDWLLKTKRFIKKRRGFEVPMHTICRSALRGDVGMTMCLHLHFGDSLQHRA